MVRSRLQARLVDAVRHHKLTLVAAPAGSGKTILSSTLTQSGLPSAWVALDSADDDLPIFVTLLASLIAMSTGDTGAAKRDLRQAAVLHERVRHTMLITHPRLALATLYGRQNRWGEALDELRAVLKSLKARGTLGLPQCSLSGLARP